MKYIIFLTMLLPGHVIADNDFCTKMKLRITDKSIVYFDCISTPNGRQWFEFKTKSGVHCVASIHNDGGITCKFPNEPMIN